MKKFGILIMLIVANTIMGGSSKFYKVVDGHLADNAGMTLYTFDKDIQEKSTCYLGCAKVWPPLLVPPNAVFTAPFSTVPRDDGSNQLSYNKLPLYFYFNDKKVGDTKGDGLQGIWHIVKLSQDNEMRVAVHCRSDGDAYQVFVLARELLSLNTPNLQPVQIQVVDDRGRIRFAGSSLVNLYPDSKHTLYLESHEKTSSAVLSAPLVKLDFLSPRFSAAIKVETPLAKDDSHVDETPVNCQLITKWN